MEEERPDEVEVATKKIKEGKKKKKVEENFLNILVL